MGKSINVFLQRVKKLPPNKALSSIRGKSSVLKRQLKSNREDLEKLESFKKALLRRTRKKRKVKNLFDFSLPYPR